MRILHTSDWHVGRTFHGFQTLDAERQVLSALAETVRAEHVDVVVIAGDVFDLSMPAAAHYALLGDALEAIVDAGARVVISSGNHDSPARLGFQAGFAKAAGVHVVTSFGAGSGGADPVILDDEHGEVRFHALPFLEPTIIRHETGDASIRSHDAAIGWAMTQVRDDIELHPGRSVALAHCFAIGGAVDVEQGDVARDITAGGVDAVSLSRLDGPDYVALGHIHSAATLSERVRYSGSPMHFSFSEAGRDRGAWIVDLGAHGLEQVTWAALPVPRQLAVLTGELSHLVSDASLARHESSWVKAIITDAQRPLDAMRTLQERFPFAAALEHRPPVAVAPTQAYAQRVAERTDREIVDAFLTLVRGEGTSDAEQAIVDDALDRLAAAERVG